MRKKQSIIKEKIDTLSLKIEDELWYFWYGNCTGMYPPSFYKTHSREEIEAILEENKREIQRMIDELPDDEKKEE